ncbi:uncharacterized protein LOC122502296 [Leptopilina heterotoma]|uniref:uncharacterized protein LOC122502296 n=1 Tax=Leptopilina heterotoma TaxID=63436 RepID=UPI001CAA016D|nr:uncharacterized protein LOC122502296 [Leptopilina heterotoma]
MNTRSAVRRGGEGRRGGNSANANRGENSNANVVIERAKRGRKPTGRVANKTAINKRGRVRRVSSRTVGSNENYVENDNQFEPVDESNEDIDFEYSENSNYHANNLVIQQRTPILPRVSHTPVHVGSSISGASTSKSGLLTLPLKDPENPISLKEALGFLPNSFDGQSMPVGQFIKGCISARNLMASKDRNHLFLMVLSRVVGNAFYSLQDRDINSLEELLLHLKNTFTEHRNSSQLHSALATVAQLEEESVVSYGSRVRRILASLVELIEDQNTNEAAHYMVQSARTTARENFIMGLKRDLVWRVRVGRPGSLDDAVNLAKQAEWEVEHEQKLDRRAPESKSDAKEKSDEGRNKMSGNNQNRHHPYDKNGRIRKLDGHRGGQRGRGGGNRNQPPNSGNRDNSATSNNNCYRCGESGHLARGCVRTVNDNKACFNCNETGHVARDCNKAPQKKRECFICKSPDHIVHNCPLLNNGNANKNKLSCTFCKKNGHLQEKCFLRLRKVYENREQKKDDLNEE